MNGIGNILMNPYAGIGFSPIQNTNATVNNAENTTGTVGNSVGAAKASECQTCENRKYQDGSNEMVSFKSAQSISPLAAASKVRAHEMEHVSNAYSKAEQGNGKVLQASVRLKTAICPECGRSYVSGGVTDTKIKYPNEDNPYMNNLKKFQEDALKGNSIDIKVG